MSNTVNDFPPVAVDPRQPYDRIRELYLYEEPALLTAIRRGDRREATRIINLILVHIYSAGEERSELLKGLLLELVIMMSRAAIEVGASQSEVLGLRYRHLTKLGGITDDAQLAHWLREALRRIFDAVDLCRTFAVPQLVRQALEAIRAGAGGALTREQVARQVGVSPGHLAQLLKERTGRSFTDLVREARIERACEMLRNTEQPLAAIALESGFCDQSYFTRVFQTLKKTTPKQYRDAGKGRMPPPGLGSA